MNEKRYQTPFAFKQAVEQRLRNISKGGADFARRRQLLVFSRFLARVTQTMGESVILKGGLALELRLERARTTKDVDLRLVGSPNTVLTQLQRAGQLDLGDFMTFEVRLDPHHPEIQNDGMLYDGIRYRTEAKLGGKPFGQPFGVDVAFADTILGEPEVVVANDVLSFADITPPKLRLYPLETHIAEKLHAYTMPRERENSRVKDLPDLALLAKVRQLDAIHLRQALQSTFDFRNTHEMPFSIPEPPSSWKEVYQRIAQEDELEWNDLPRLLLAVSAFLNPVLNNKPVTGRWYPDKWA